MEHQSTPNYRAIAAITWNDYDAETLREMADEAWMSEDYQAWEELSALAMDKEPEPVLFGEISDGGGVEYFDVAEAVKAVAVQHIMEARR